MKTVVFNACMLSSTKQQTCLNYLMLSMQRFNPNTHSHYNNSLSLFITHTHARTHINHIFLEVIRGVSVRSFEKWKSSKLMCPRYFSLDENNLFCLIYLSYTLRTPNIKIQTSSAKGSMLTFL